MGKVNLLVKCCLINGNFEYNIKGILRNNELIFTFENSKMHLNLVSNVLEKETKGTLVILDFNNSKCLYILKENNKKLEIPIEVLELENIDNLFKVKYKNIDNTFLLIIKII